MVDGGWLFAYVVARLMSGASVYTTRFLVVIEEAPNVLDADVRRQSAAFIFSSTFFLREEDGTIEILKSKEDCNLRQGGSKNGSIRS